MYIYKFTAFFRFITFITGIVIVSRDINKVAPDFNIWSHDFPDHYTSSKWNNNLPSGLSAVQVYFRFAAMWAAHSSNCRKMEKLKPKTISSRKKGMYIHFFCKSKAYTFPEQFGFGALMTTDNLIRLVFCFVFPFLRCCFFPCSWSVVVKSSNASISRMAVLFYDWIVKKSAENYDVLTCVRLLALR